MGTRLSINDKIIILSNNLDGRCFAILNTYKLPHCRNVAVNINCISEYVGIKLGQALVPIIEVLSKNEKKETYNELPFHHLIFNTTYKCNLSCKYCYFSANSIGESIDAKTIEHSIRKCLNYINDNAELTVLFQGGEALLEYDTIRDALERLGEQPRIKYQIQTNGTLITNDIMNFFEKHNFHVSFSLDSYVHEHNSLRSNRTQYFTDKMFDVCQMFQERNMDYGVISVVCKNNIDDLVKMFHEFVKRGIHTFAYNLLWPIGRAETENMDQSVVSTEKLVETLSAVYSEIYQYNIDCGYKPFEKFRERNLYMLWQRLFYRKLSNYMCMNTPCGAGVNTLTVDVNGEVYPCALMLPSLESGFKIGNIYTDSISSLIQKDSIIKNRDLDLIAPCVSCVYRATCSGGGCGIAFYHLEKNINAVSLYCDYYHEILSFMIEHAMIKSNIRTLKNF